MRHYVGSLLALTVFVTAGLPAQAAAVRQEIRTQVGENARERRSTIAQVHGNRLENRFSMYEQRLRNIYDRLVRVVAEHKRQGQDVSSLERKLREADTKLDAAQAAADDAIEGFLAIEPEAYDEQRDAALAARDKAQEARRLFVEAHRLLRDIIADIKSLKGQE